MAKVRAIYHRMKKTNLYALGGDRFLIEAFLQGEIHDVHAEVEIEHPSVEVLAARFWRPRWPTGNGSWAATFAVWSTGASSSFPRWF